MKSLVLLTATALMVAACGGDTGAEPTPTVPEGTPGDVILEISEEGGFVPVEFNLTRVPRFTVFADGSVVWPAGQQFMFPGPVIRPVVRTTVDADTLTDLLTFVADLGLDDIDSVELNNAPNVADASTTVVRFFDDAGEHRISIYALGFDSAADARFAIVESMIDRLAEATDQAESTPYEADRVVVHGQSAANFDPEAQTTSRPWPFDFSPDDMSADIAGTACRTLEGDAASAAIAALESADSLTIWDSDGDEYRVFARPLLPHQDGC